MCEKQEIIYEKNTRKIKLLSIVLMASLVLGIGLSTEVRAKSKIEKGLLDIRSAGASEFNPSKDQQTFMSIMDCPDRKWINAVLSGIISARFNEK